MADDKDRRTRMATSSMRQPPKKDGAGVANWGTATDVTDFEPIGFQHSTVQVVSATPVQGMMPRGPPLPPQQMTADITSQQAFPTLGNTAPPSARVVKAWGPGETAPQPRGLQQPVLAVPVPAGRSPRESADLGANQPRNTFARQPLKSPGLAEGGVPAVPAIDWSGGGIPQQVAVDPVAQRQMAAAHLTAIQGQLALQQQQQAVPLTVLRAQGVPASQAAPQMKVPPKHVMSMNRPVQINQPQGRR
eukprot:NODE_9794_length_1399_cov_5.349057.p1 GENE.NODE_9794_length_1399_cov_5.349057~~NODE_9794_length_1399_cov_5.349057.p1  ORF type:complete len:247 (+),score=68.26 NODE_9794_length_1399_cov_5.349057:98-838(+)